MKYKAKDIAKEMGVSPATVSLVMNGKPGVGDKLRKEIISKIDEMNCGYLIKDELVGKGTIGMVIYKCDGNIIDEFPFFGFLLENINRVIGKHNYQMNMIYLNNGMSSEEQKHILENSSCKGYIVYAVEMQEKDIEVFNSINEPSVFLDNSFAMSKTDTVAIDNNLGVYQALEYLRQKGHRRIGYIMSRIQIESFRERYNAYKEIMTKFQLEFHDRDTIRVGYVGIETERDVIEYLKKTSDLPTAFFADNDLLACRAVQGMKEMGYKVPEDISVVGFDDRPICNFTEPPVTTIGISRDDMGNIAVEVLMSKLEDKRKCSLKTRIGTTLIERASVIDRNIMPKE